MAQDESTLEWSLSANVDGELIELRTAKEVRSFLNDQRDFYEFIREDEASLKQGALSHPLAWANRLNQLDGLVTQAISDSNALNQVQAHLNDVGKSKLPFHNSVEAQAIKRIWEEYGPLEGAGAALMFADMANQEIWNGRRTASGAILAILADLDVDTKKAQDFERQLTDIRSRHEKGIAAVNELSANSAAEFRSFMDDSEKQNDDVRQFLMSGLQQLGEDQEARASQAIESISATEKVYTEHMQFRAPRDYWAKKATGHEKRRWWFATAALLWFALGGLAVATLGWKLFNTAINLSVVSDVDVEAPITVLASLGGAALLSTTIYLWIARILVRLFLSEIHLGMDARERVVMVDSYLALLNENEGAVENEHRSIVLTALFRPTQDGIVKDDAAADPTLLSALRSGLRS